MIKLDKNLNIENIEDIEDKAYYKGLIEAILFIETEFVTIKKLRTLNKSKRTTNTMIVLFFRPITNK